MKIGFIGLGNVGAKLAGSIQRHGHELWVRDLDRGRAAPILSNGAHWADSPRELTENCHMIITCLPNPAACSRVLEANDGILAGLSAGKIWAEMSTTDAAEVIRLADLVRAKGAEPIECPASSGCHRAATGNISIFAGCSRETFERVLPILTVLGRRVLHTGDVGTASILKVTTNYLATANLVTLCEALVTCKAAGLDLNTTYEAIRISSGNSFVHETESQVILNGSRDISFTMDLVLKDISLFQKIAEGAGVDLEISPKLVEIFKDGIDRFGPRELSPNIIRRLEETSGITIRAPGFPPEIVDDEAQAAGYEVTPNRG